MEEYVAGCMSEGVGYICAADKELTMGKVMSYRLFWRWITSFILLIHSKCSNPFWSRLFLEKMNKDLCAIGAMSLCLFLYLSRYSHSLSSLSIVAFIPEFAEVLPAGWKVTRAGLSYNQPSHSKTYLPGLPKVTCVMGFALEVHHNWSDVMNLSNVFAVGEVPWQGMGAEFSQYASWTTFL